MYQVSYLLVKSKQIIKNIYINSKTKINCDQQISCLSIHPSSHESIALGLKNGQICVKNLSINSAGNKNTDSIENFFDVYSNVSNSHRMAVTDIKWMPFEQKVFIILKKIIF